MFESSPEVVFGAIPMAASNSAAGHRHFPFFLPIGTSTPSQGSKNHFHQDL
jgi:hypothetical protein